MAVDVKFMRRRMLEIALLIHEDHGDEFYEFVSRIEGVIQQAKLAEERYGYLPPLNLPSSLSESLKESREDLRAQGVDVEAMEVEHKERLDHIEDWYNSALGEYSKLFKKDMN